MLSEHPGFHLYFAASSLESFARDHSLGSGVSFFFSRASSPPPLSLVGDNCDLSPGQGTLPPGLSCYSLTKALHRAPKAAFALKVPGQIPPTHTPWGRWASGVSTCFLLLESG